MELEFKIKGRRDYKSNEISDALFKWAESKKEFYELEIADLPTEDVSINEVSFFFSWNFKILKFEIDISN